MASVFSLWVGGPLSPYEVLSLRSFLQHGHAFTLYSYDRRLRVPAGVELRDAAEILPRHRLHRDGRGAWAGFADLFRYAALARHGGIWVDCDIVCLSPDWPAALPLTAWQDERKLCIAVLGLEAGSPIARDLFAEAAAIDGRRMAWSGRGAPLVARQLARHGAPPSLPAERFFPVGPGAVDRLFVPDEAAALTAETASSLGLHFWNERLRRAGFDKRWAPPAGSFMDGLFRRYCPECTGNPRYVLHDLRRMGAVSSRLWRFVRRRVHKRAGAWLPTGGTVFFEKSPYLLRPARPGRHRADGAVIGRPPGRVSG